MTARERLPQRRRCETLSFALGGLLYQATVGYYPDGRVGEIFLNGAKLNSDTDTSARDSAIMASFALQHGAELECLRSACTRAADGSADGPLGKLLDLLTHPRLVRP
ncbi:MAG: hypothetical protein WA441_13420 [Methyloceanibacter sp.]